jgi:uncharacterized protein
VNESTKFGGGQSATGHTARRRLVLPLALFALLALPLSSSLLALDVPPTPTRWYTDTANLLNVTDATALDQKLKAFEERSGAQFLIYVFPTLGGEALEPFTIRCAEKWKAGQKKYDNGLFLFVFVAEKKTRVEVGYGLEGTVTDSVSSDVLRNDIPPHFQSGDYAGGLNAAADDLIARIEKKEAPVPVSQTASRQTGTARRSSGGIDPIFFFVIVIVFLLFIRPLLRGRRGGGGCGGCIPLFLPWGGSGMTFGGGGFGGGGGGGWGGGGGGGFSGGGGGFGGGGASGGW